jgi:methylmalonyl-CoA/ethylmalonyl-CoA epimerase
VIHAHHPFGESARFHHVGMVVRSIQDLFPGIEPIPDPIQRVRVAFVDMHGAVVELIEPHGDVSPVTRALQRGERLVHLCYQVDDLHAALASAESGGFHTIHSPVPAIAFGGRLIAWVFHPHFGLCELLES